MIGWDASIISSLSWQVERERTPARHTQDFCLVLLEAPLDALLYCCLMRASRREEETARAACTNGSGAKVTSVERPPV
jgi:hypothetical protein